VSHLGNHLSALVDGELSGADLDRANAHLASCDRCRGEAAALRELKRQLRALAADAGGDALTTRLLAMAGTESPASRSVASSVSGSYQALVSHARAPRLRYLVWSAVSLAVVGGLGAAAFSMGGNGSSPEPNVVPQVEMFNVEHAIITGDVPFPDPGSGPMKVPVKQGSSQAP
jgi:anti-sigma factor RsiW